MSGEINRRAFTATASVSALGTVLLPGAPADLIVLPATPGEPAEAAAALAEVRPRLVIIDGEVALER